MKYKIIKISIILAVIILLSTTVTASGLADSPQPKFRHDDQNTGTTSNTGPQTYSVKWAYDTGDMVTSSPSIGKDGTIYIGCWDENLYAFSPDGGLKWTFNTAEGIYSTPALADDGGIYFGADMFYALTPTGKLKWTYDVTGWDDNGMIWSSPAIAKDGTIYFGYDSLYAMNPDGTLKWSYTPPGDYNPEDIILSSPALAKDGTIYFGLDKFYALTPNGKLKWYYPTGDYVDSSPAVDKEGNIYFGGDDKIFYALTPQGKLKWKFKAGDEIYSSPALASDGSIYFGCEDGNLYALTNHGQLKWKYAVGTEIYSSPLIDKNGNIYFGADVIYSISKDGKFRWAYDTGRFVDSSPAISPDGTIYFGDADYNNYEGTLFAIQDSLAIKNISGPSPAIIGEKFTIISTITNQYSIGLRDIMVKYYLTPHPTSGVKYYLGEKYIRYLDPNESQKISSRLMLPEIPLGGYYITILANNVQAFSESKIKIIKSGHNQSTAHGRTIRMVETGIPIFMLLMAILMLCGGFYWTKK